MQVCRMTDGLPITPNSMSKEEWMDQRRQKELQNYRHLGLKFCLQEKLDFSENNVMS